MVTVAAAASNPTNTYPLSDLPLSDIIAYFINDARDFMSRNSDV
jgi:hypothetical protein